jgi:hypothetical protein
VPVKLSFLTSTVEEGHGSCALHLRGVLARAREGCLMYFLGGFVHSCRDSSALH